MHMKANMWNNTDVCFLHCDFLCIDAKFIQIFILALDLECDVIDLLYKKIIDSPNDSHISTFLVVVPTHPSMPSGEWTENIEQTHY